MSTRVVSLVLNNFVNDNRVLKEVRSLSAAGYELTVSALSTNGEPLEEEHPEFKVRRIRLKTAVLPRGKFWGGIKYAELVLTTLWRYRNYDIWHCNDFEPLMMVWMLRIFRKKPLVVYDAHEYAREKNGLGKLEKKIVRYFEPICIKKANRVITVSEGIAEEYERLYGIKDVEVIYNAPHAIQLNEKPDIFRMKFGIAKEKVIFLYQGKFHKGRGIELVLQATEYLRNTNAVLVFMGSGGLVQEVERVAETNENVYFHPEVPYEAIIQHTASADFGLLTVENICLSYYYCMPNKMFEYIQAGIPILTTNLYDCKNLITKEHIGLVIPEFTAKSFGESILKAMETDTAQFREGLRSAASKYHWKVEEEKLIRLYRGVKAP